MKTSCFVLCCLLVLGASFALPTPGLTQSPIEIRIVVAPGQTTQPMSMSNPRGRFALNDENAGREITFEPPPVPREPVYARNAVYTQVSPGRPDSPGVDVGKGFAVTIMADAAAAKGPGSVQPLVLVLSIPPNVSGEVSIQYSAAGLAAPQRQILRAAPAPGLRISDISE